AYDAVDHDAAKAAFQSIFKSHGRLDVMVNNAGIMEAAPLGMITADALHRTLEVDLASAILHLQAAARLMARGKSGAIVNVSSVAGVCGAEGLVAYSAAKAGLIGATLAAAKELAASGVRVNAI